jgi:DNA-directed RNA polymerase specialized sigma24 family protein
VTRAIDSSATETRWPSPGGFEEFFRESFRELVRVAMYAGATLQEAEDTAAKTLTEMLSQSTPREWTLPYARKATIHNFVKDKTRGSRRVAQRLIERGQVPHGEGAEDSQLTVWEDEEWVAYVLSRLPPSQREVMECIARGLDRGEIAEVLGKTRDAVRQNLCAARARLARELHPNREQGQPPRMMARSSREEAR